MKLKNVLIVVNDIERSREFYKDLFGLELVLDNDGNMVLTEGLALQDAAIWRKFIKKETEKNRSRSIGWSSDVKIGTESVL